MVKATLRFLREFTDLYTGKRIPLASAALSYYLTMTVFPTVIVLYTLLGAKIDLAVRIVVFAGRFLAKNTVEALMEFLGYVARNNSPAMLFAGLSLVITSASAATRSMNVTISDMQGGQHFKGVHSFLVSIVFSLVFVLTVYFSVIVMITGHAVLDILATLLPFIDANASWEWLRFVILFGIELLIMWIIYLVPQYGMEKYHVLPGAFIASVALVLDSMVFSLGIGLSTRYSLVYGSLAAIILMMFWLYTCGIIIFSGAALNIVIRDMLCERKKATE